MNFYKFLQDIWNGFLSFWPGAVAEYQKRADSLIVRYQGLVQASNAIVRRYEQNHMLRHMSNVDLKHLVEAIDHNDGGIKTGLYQKKVIVEETILGLKSELDQIITDSVWVKVDLIEVREAIRLLNEGRSRIDERLKALPINFYINSLPNPDWA